MPHAAVLEVVDASIVVGGDELLRRAGQRGDVAAAVLIGVLRVADQRDVAQGENAIGTTERDGCRVDRRAGRRAGHAGRRSLLRLLRDGDDAAEPAPLRQRESSQCVAYRVSNPRSFSVSVGLRSPAAAAARSAARCNTAPASIWSCRPRA